MSDTAWLGIIGIVNSLLLLRHFLWHHRQDRR